MQGGTSSPLPEPPSLVRDVGGAFGASLRVRGRLRGSREDQLIHRAEPMITATLGSFTVQGGDFVPPSGTPLLCPGCWGRLRRFASRPGPASGGSGRSTHTQGGARAYSTPWILLALAHPSP